MKDYLKFYRLSGATFYDCISCINTIYQFIKSVLDNKMSIFEECGAFNMVNIFVKKMNFCFLYILMFLLSPEDVESALIRMTKLVLTGPLDEIDLREDARYVVCDT